VKIAIITNVNNFDLITAILNDDSNMPMLS